MGTSVISMYSFKGGAGRTLSTANLLAPLADALGAGPSAPILVLDMDLDSAGLTTVLDEDEVFRSPDRANSSSLVSGKLALIRRPVREKFFATDLLDVSQRVGCKDPGTVRFLGGAAVGSEQKVVGKSYENLRELVSQCNDKGFKAIVMDSASGRQDSAMLCHDVSDVVVYCCRMSMQFLRGTRGQLEYYFSACQRDNKKPAKVVIVPLAVPKPRPQFAELFASAEAQLDSLATKAFGITQGTLVRGGVPEVESFKWFELILRARGRLDATDEKAAAEAFARIADEIVKTLSQK